MNKIININLAGRLIPIDESAYEQLRDYLNRIKIFFSREKGGDEIVHDMEDRMGELFQDKLKKGASCILAQDIADMISVMGSPEQIESETAEEEPQRGNQSREEQPAASAPGGARHLSRNGRDKMIGGVCSGIATYFNIDPTIIRVALILITLAWGAGLVVYLLLWAILPETSAPSAITRRRLYRNPKQKVVGGVCAGIAAYANIDPIIPRVVFAAPLLGMIFFGVLDNDIFFFPALVGGLPTLVLLYIILWASLPEANTVAEKLEMRGEKVDVHNLSQAIKGAETDRPSIAQRSGVGKLFVILVKVFVFFILGTILLALAGVIIAVLAALFGMAASSAFLFPFSELITQSATERTVLWICIILTLAIPFIAIIRLLVRLITGRKKEGGSRWLSVTFAILFIAGVFGLFWVGSSIASDFKAFYRKTYPLALSQPANDTLIIRQDNSEESGIMDEDDWNDQEGLRFMDDSTIAINNIALRIVPSPDNLYHVSVQKSARGKTMSRAQTYAEPLQFSYRQEGNTIYLPRDFVLPKGHPFRAQKLKLEIQVPVGKVFKTTDMDSYDYRDRSFTVKPVGFRYTTIDSWSWDDNVYYKMGTDGPIEQKQPEETEDRAEDNTNRTNSDSTRR